MPLNNPITPYKETKTGANLSGSTGAKNRTITLAYLPMSSSLSVTVNGAGLHEGVGLDYTYASQVITFLNAVDNVDNIEIRYCIA